MLWEQKLTDKCFHSFFEFSFIHLTIEVHSYFGKKARRICSLLKNTFTKCKERKISNLFDYQNKNSLCSHDKFCSSEQIMLVLVHWVLQKNIIHCKLFYRVISMSK